MSGGVSRSNVAVTDTFDTWRLRTNEINDSLNQGTAANTANTIMWRDDAGTANVNVLNANTANVTHTDGTTSALTVTSAVAAASDGTKAAILTTGGIYGTLDSKFAADLTIGTDLSVEGNSVLGNAVTDTITFTGRIATGTDLIPIANNSSDLGSSALQYAETHFQKQTMVGSGTDSSNVLGITASAATNTAVSMVNNSLTSGSVLAISSSATDTTARNLATITQSGDVTTSGDTTGLKLAMTSGRGIFIDSNDVDGNYIKELEHLASSSKKVVAIGEIGIDHYRNLSPADIQRKVMIEQMELANSLNLPIIFHNRDADDEIFNVLKEHIIFHKLQLRICPTEESISIPATH